MTIIRHRMRAAVTFFFIVTFLFDYVNFTMFWHAHSVNDYVFYHSHIHGKAHTTGDTDGGHTPDQLNLLSEMAQSAYSDKVVPAFDLNPFRPVVDAAPVERVMPVSDFSSCARTLRGPPALV